MGNQCTRHKYPKDKTMLLNSVLLLIFACILILSETCYYLFKKEKIGEENGRC